MHSEQPSTETLFYSLLSTPLGWLTVIVSERGLFAIRFAAEFAPIAPHATLCEDAPATSEAVRQLGQYFRHERRQFDLALDLRGTEFQQACWRELLKIPYGEVRTYADIARALGRPAAFRAVGMANHSNPIPIVIPCHRVLASNGQLAGYAGGIDIKRKLLELEGTDWRPKGRAAEHAQLTLMMD